MTTTTAGIRKNSTCCARSRSRSSTVTGKKHERQSRRCCHDAISARELRTREEASRSGRPSEHLQREGRARVVAEITKNLTPAGDPAFVLIDISTPEGK